MRLSQGDREFRKRRLIPFPGHLEHKVKSPASLKRESAVAGCLGRAAPFWAPASGIRTCTIARSSGTCACSRSCELSAGGHRQP